jgi:hypothetical protein
METATRPARPQIGRPDGRPPSRGVRIAAAGAGPALIVVSVVIAMRGFAFLPRITNQHSDVLSQWLPWSCLLGDALSTGRVPLWSPFEMAGRPFAADAQSGWLSATTMSTSWLFGCGGGLRAVVVLNPILAGLGLWWFLRREGLGRIAATAGGLSMAMTIAASSVAISLPFAGFLAWTPFVLVGASGFLSASGWRRLPWLALAAFAWGQVAAAHLSHGLAICTGLLVAYIVARAIRDTRAGALTRRGAIAFSAGFVAFLPVANLAILIPRLELIARSSLHAGYGVLGGTVVDAAGVLERPIPEHGVWSGWPLALASTPGAYVGAAILLALPFAFRDRPRRFLAWGVGIAALVAYLMTLTVFVGAGWFRAIVLRLPYGDVYLHNPGRLRYAAYLAVPILGAIGVQWLLDERPRFATVVRTLASALGVLVLVPLLFGANPERLLVFAVGTAAVVGSTWALARGRRWAPAALVVVLAAELLGAALWSSSYRGGTIFFGLEDEDRPALVHGPLRWPRVDLRRYLDPGPIATAIAQRDDGRYLAWVPPAAYFNKGYLFTQDEADWPALLLGRAVLFELHDALGYSPIQVARYWSFIRATNDLPVFYNAAVIQLPSLEDVRLLGVGYLIAHEAQQLPAAISGDVIASERGHVLYELDGAQPRVSVVPAWRVVDGVGEALEAVTTRGFDPALTAIVETDPGIGPSATPGAPSGSATYTEVRPEVVRIDVVAETPSLVVVRNAWERGWEATVDGSPVRVLAADAFLQAVPVPAGEHEIRLTYREPAIGRGIAASAIAWSAFVGALVVLLAMERRRARPRRAPRRDV